jgi:hypothetical protein
MPPGYNPQDEFKANNVAARLSVVEACVVTARFEPSNWTWWFTYQGETGAILGRKSVNQPTIERLSETGLLKYLVNAEFQER